MDADSKSKPLHENLDTTFVNLWSLLRSLTQKGFIGRVHVESTDYSADVFMNGSASPLVHEIDRAAGTETLEEAALHRLVLRAREAPGTISVFEGADEAAVVPTLASKSETPAGAAPLPIEDRSDRQSEVPFSLEQRAISEVPPVAVVESSQPAKEFRRSEKPVEEIYPAGSYNDWPAILATTGELIGAIERGINASGGDFDSLFTAARVDLADDYSFLDPFAQIFMYGSGVATLNHPPAVKIFVSALGEALRRTIDRAAVGERARRIRERVALEMLAVARKHSEVLERSGLQAQLDRIAGTRVM
jgi:hypothetical protein